MLESEATATDAVVTGSLDEKGILSKPRKRLYKPQFSSLKYPSISYVFFFFFFTRRQLQKSADSAIVLLPPQLVVTTKVGYKI